MVNWLMSLLPVEYQKQELLKRCPDGALKNYLSTPFVKKNQTIADIDILSVDFETTGLDAKKDKLLSLGFVTLHQGRIELSTSYHQVIRCSGTLEKNNVVVHQITDDEKERGTDLKLALDSLLTAMTGKVLLVHYANIERNFIRRACIEIYGIAPPLLVIDTLKVCKKRLDKHQQAYDPSELRLVNLRSKLGLPNFHAHNALNDAIATAELLLVEVKHHHLGLNTPISHLL